MAIELITFKIIVTYTTEKYIAVSARLDKCLQSKRFKYFHGSHIDKVFVKRFKVSEVNTNSIFFRKGAKYNYCGIGRLILNLYLDLFRKGWKNKISQFLLIVKKGDSSKSLAAYQLAPRRQNL